jgi:hypothetical protein
MALRRKLDDAPQRALCRGVIYDPAELFAAVGMRGR